MSLDRNSGPPPDAFGGSMRHRYAGSSGDDFAAGGSVVPQYGSQQGSGGSAQSDNAIEFRVLRHGTPNRRLRLSGSRYTIGSAEGCSILLNDPDLRPVHAVLIREDDRVAVRAYSGSIEVDGIETVEASLHIGSVVRFGSYSFELVAGAVAPAADSYAGPPAAGPPSQGGDARMEPPAGAGYDSAQSGEHLRRQIDSWKGREIDRWQDQPIGLEPLPKPQGDREAQLRSREAELWARAEDLSQREARLQSQEVAASQLFDVFSERQQEMTQPPQGREAGFGHRRPEPGDRDGEYRRQLEEATMQLQQSRQQSAEAAEAVRRMRQQFDSLNSEIEELIKQQARAANHDSEHRDQARAELEAERDQALKDRRSSSARCDSAERKVQELEAQIEALRSEQEAELQEREASLEASENAAQQLREQVAELTGRVTEANEESSRLRSDYEEACNSVEMLQTLVNQSNERGDQDRASWTVEEEKLNATVEHLSIQLAAANRELGELREANNSFAKRLEVVQRERDKARAEAQLNSSSDSSDALGSLQDELSETKNQLSQMTQNYEDTLARLTALEPSSAGDIPSSIPAAREFSENKAADPVEASTDDSDDDWAESAFGDQDQQDDPSDQESDHEESYGEPESSESSDDAVWGSGFSSRELGESSDDGDAFSDDEVDSTWGDESGPDQRDAEHSLPSNDSADDSPEMTAVWDEAPEPGDDHALPDGWSDEGPNDQSDPAAGKGLLSQAESDISSVWGDAEEGDEAEDDAEEDDAEEGDAEEGDDTRYEAPEGGSLANMLLNDLKADLEKDRESEDEGEQAPQWSESESDQDAAQSEDVEPVWDPAASADPPNWSDPAQQADGENEDELGDLRGSDPTADEATSADPESEIEYEEPILLPESDEPSAEPQPAAAPAGGEGDDSIEAYMNRLLGKVHDEGDGSESEPISVELSQPVGQWNTGLGAPEEAEEEDLKPQQPASTDDDAMMPRKSAPERMTDLDAMRQLANDTARSAISESVRVQNRDTEIKAIANYLYAAGTALCGFACFLLLHDALMYVGVALTAIITVIFIKEGNKLFAEAERRKNMGTHNVVPSKDDDDFEEVQYEYEYIEYEEEYDEEDEG